MKRCWILLGVLGLLGTAAAAQGGRPVVWKVNGIAGGNATVGTISVAGLYTAPLAVPAVPVVTVTVTSVEDPTKFAAARVTIVLPPPPPIERVEIQPSTATVEVGKQLAFTQQVISRGTPVPRQGGASYALDVGIDMTAAGALDVILPDRYTVGNFGHALTPGGVCNAGLPAIGTVWYECDFLNATSAVEGHPASTFDRFGVPLVILHERNPSVGDTTANAGPHSYPTIQRVTDDSTYIFGEANGNVTVRHFIGASIGQLVKDAFVCGTSNGNQRWLTGAHNHKLLCMEGENLIVYDVDLDRYCTTDPNTCGSVSKVSYHANPVAGVESFGCNEGDVIPGNYLPLVADCGTFPAIYRYDVANKSTVTMASPPGTSIDHCDLSPDAAKMNCQTNGGNQYTWNAATGAAVTVNATPGVGHAGYGMLADGTAIIFTFNDVGGTPFVQRKSRRLWDTATFTDLFQHNSPRDPDSSAADSHFSLHAKPGSACGAFSHCLALFDTNSINDGDTTSVTAGALSDPAWKQKWRAFTAGLIILDYNNVSGNISGAPNGWLVMHNRSYDSEICYGSTTCAQITRDGCWFVTNSHLSTDVSGSGRRIYAIRGGPLRNDC
jgi:hypothetical protein